MGLNTHHVMHRRDFIQKMAIAGSGMFILGNFGFIFNANAAGINHKAILIDFGKCTGCRTCESVCAAFNHKVVIEDEGMNGLGNPWLSNIRVHHFNPDIDIPNVCSFCLDAPCIEACPTEVDEQKGHKALYRTPNSLVIRNDKEICISCKSCIKACKKHSRGVLMPDEDGAPARMCTLCEGDPQCAKFCPYQAISVYNQADLMPYTGMSPEKIASQLIETYYKN